MNKNDDEESSGDEDDFEDEDQEDTDCPSMCAFADSVASLVDWGKSFNLESSIKKNDGLVIIDNFLPDAAAQEVRNMLHTSEPELWELNADDGDDDDTSHQFLSCSTHPDPGFSAATRAIWSLMTDRLPSFSAARYNVSDHIAMHDDSLVIVGEKSDNVDDGELLYRDIAVVLYMVDDEWDGEKDGGVLLDWGPTNKKFKQPKEIIPKFNRLVCFQVPRFHEVTKVVSRSDVEEEEDRPRLSLFGWFLTDKKLY